MQLLLIFFLIISFLIFLFTLYFLTNDDLIIIKKDMPMDKVFNTAFLTAFASLLFARIFYVIFNPKEIFLNPLGFFLFPYFPGLSLLGGVIGGCLFLIFYAKNQKLPVGRIFDFFAISALSAFPVGFLGSFILTGKSYLPVFIFSFTIYVILFAVFIKVFLPASFRASLKNGSLGLIFLICFSVVTFLSGIILNFKNLSLITGENLVLFSLFIISGAFFLKQEMTGGRRHRK